MGSVEDVVKGDILKDDHTSDSWVACRVIHHLETQTHIS